MSELTVIQPNTLSVYNDSATFGEAQRMCQALASSAFVPTSYQNNLANCLVAMDVSRSMGISVLEVMRNLNVIKGKPGWSSEYTISAINMSGKFSEDLQFEYAGEGDQMSCYAYTKRKGGKTVKGSTISIAMAKADGWYDRAGSKWKTMPEQMLAYRAATFFARLHCPQVLRGIQTADEIIDVGHVEEKPLDRNPLADINAQVAPEAVADPGKTEPEFTEFTEVTEGNDELNVTVNDAQHVQASEQPAAEETPAQVTNVAETVAESIETQQTAQTEDDNF